MLNIDTIVDLLASHAMSLGYFDRVNTHQTRISPGNQVTAAVWFQTLAPVRTSGLASTSVRLEFTLRQYQSSNSEPQDAIDPTMLKAADALFTAYSGDFELGGESRSIDLLGAEGTALSMDAGYIEVSGMTVRVIDHLIPIIINDVYDQAP